MNLLFRPSPVSDGSRRRLTPDGQPASTASILAAIAPKLAAAQAQLAAKVAQLEAACGEAERAELEWGSSSSPLGNALTAAKSIEPLVREITELEGRIEYLTRAQNFFD